MIFDRVLGPPIAAADGVYPDHHDFWYGLPQALTGSGFPVSTESAMAMSAAYACARILAGAIAMLPVDVIGRVSEDEREHLTDHPVARLYNIFPNDSDTAFDYKLFQVLSLALDGNFYAEKKRSREGRLGAVVPILSQNVYADRVRETRRMVYDVSSAHDGRARTLGRDDVQHIKLLSLDGVRGLSVIGLAREGIGVAQAAQLHAAKFFSQGARVSGFLTTEAGYNKEKDEEWSKAWAATHSGVTNHWKTATLYGGMKFQSVQMTNEDAQFLELMQYQVIDIARRFGVPLWLLQAQEKETAWGSGLEQMATAFVQYTLGYYLAPIEASDVRELLRESEWGRVQVKRNVNALLRGDIATRFESYVKGIQNGIYAPNEVRRHEDMNPRKDGHGDEYLQPSNMQVAGQPLVRPPNGAGKQTADAYRGQAA